jgi:hypothetical protein
MVSGNDTEAAPTTSTSSSSQTELDDASKTKHTNGSVAVDGEWEESVTATAEYNKMLLMQRRLRGAFYFDSHSNSLLSVGSWAVPHVNTLSAAEVVCRHGGSAWYWLETTTHNTTPHHTTPHNTTQHITTQQAKYKQQQLQIAQRIVLPEGDTSNPLSIATPALANRESESSSLSHNAADSEEPRKERKKVHWPIHTYPFAVRQRAFVSER